MKPRIAVMLDENTKDGGTDYKLPKNYFRAIAHAGAIPYGIPYCEDFIENAVKEFDGFFSVGGAVQLPSEWYVEGHAPLFPFSERIAIERAIMASFLAADKPVLGSCNGMQLMAGLHGCKLRSDANPSHRHNHEVSLINGTTVARLIGNPKLTVNSRHSEAIASASSQVTVAAIAEDGTIEAIEIPDKKFAIGLQWHQEDFWNSNHAGNAVISAFVDACRS